MTTPLSPNTLPPSPKNTMPLLRTANISYGLFVGLGFALFVWGYDGWLLAWSSADMAWAKLWLGLPWALCVGAVAGFVSSLSSRLSIIFGIWIVAFGLLSWAAGHIPFEGLSWLVGWTETHFANMPIYPYLPANAFRTWLVVIINCVLGLVAGYGQMLFVNWAWDQSTAKGKLSTTSWLLLAMAIWVALLPALVTHQFIMQPLRLSRQRVAHLVKTTLKGGLEAIQKQGQNYIEAERYGAYFSPDFTLYFVGFDPKTEDLYTAYADVVFADDFTLRCIVMGNRVTFCEEYNEKLANWINDLVHVGLTGERRWLDDATKTFQPEGQVVQWLQTHKAELSPTYTWTTLIQRGSWRLIKITFEQDVAIVCRLHGVQTVIVDHCETSIP